MTILLTYLFVGLLLYPCSMDMWYRTCYKRNEFYNPARLGWYIGFTTFVLFWIFAFPFQIYHYLKESK